MVSKKSIDIQGNEVISTKVKYGCERIIPGGLSVSRSLGDISAKEYSLGGNPKVLIADPEIKKVVLSGDEDF